MTAVQMTTTTGTSKPRRPRKIAIIGAAAAALAALSILAFWGWRTLAHRHASPAQDPVAIAKLISTPAFAQLSFEQKAQYLKTLRSNMPALVAAARSGKLTREEQIAAVRTGVKIGAQVEMHNYFALPPGPARQALLDRLINEQEQLRGYAAHARQQGPLQFDSGVELKEFVESLPPSDRVQMAQFGFEMFKRRQERGLPLWPYGH